MNMQTAVQTTEPTMIERIDNIFATHKIQRLAIQAVLIDSMLHVEAHGDVGFISYFVGKLASEDGKGMKGDAIVEWINTFTKAEVSYDATKKAYNVVFKREKKNNIELAKTKAWWQFKNKPMVTFDLVDSLTQVTSLNSQRGKDKQRLLEQGKHEEASEIHTDSELAAAVKLLLANRALVQMVLDTTKVEVAA